MPSPFTPSCSAICSGNMHDVIFAKGIRGCYPNYWAETKRGILPVGVVRARTTSKLNRERSQWVHMTNDGPTDEEEIAVETEESIETSEAETSEAVLDVESVEDREQTI